MVAMNLGNMQLPHPDTSQYSLQYESQDSHLSRRA